MAKRPVARVLPDSRLPQLDRLFDYAIPAGMSVDIGFRVKVPMGRGGRLQAGYVVDIADESDYLGDLAPVDSVVSAVGVLTPELRQLATAVAARSAGGVSDVLRLAIPPRAVRVENQWLERDTPNLELPDAPPPPEDLSDQSWQHLLTPGSRSWWQSPYGLVDVAGVSIPRHHHDIARLAVSVLAGGHSAVLCVPDWRDVELLEHSLKHLVSEQFLTRFDPQHTPSERYRAYLRSLEHTPVIAYGSRHVIYAPVSQLGLVLVSQDGDDSHREPLAPYPTSRDIALLRAEQAQSAVVLSSHLPSIDTVRLLEMGYLSPIRPLRDNRPRVIPPALGRHDPNPSNPARLPSVAFHAVREALSDGPVLVQVFHAGYSAGLACVDCGVRARCDHCGGPLRQTTRGRSHSCGWCGQLAAGWQCPECRSTALRPVGQGLGRTSAELGKAFPGVAIVRSDGEHRVLRVPSKPALVVATRGAEPVADGGYRAALLLDADAMLQRPALDALEASLAAWEWALSLLTPGAMAYLTDLDGPIAQAVASGAMENLLSRELAERASLRMPPAVRVASITGPRTSVHDLVADLTARPGVDALGPFATEDGARALLRMSYRDASEVATELRAAVIRQASESGKRAARLRVVMDDTVALDNIAMGDS